MLKHNVNLFEGEACKEYLAKVNWKDSTKALAVSMLEIWFKHTQISWNPPTYEAVKEIPYMPTEAQIDVLISASGKVMGTYLQRF